MPDVLGPLLSDISRLMRKRFDQRARAYNVTRAQWRTMFVLSRNEGINQGGLAELLEVEPITVCRMVDRMEEAGLVERRRDMNDRRAWRIYLTPEADPILEELHRIAEELVGEALRGFSLADQAMLIRMLGDLRSNVTNAVATVEVN